ncbi:hypothetical protein OG255_45080 (plasmid) [Streptomyces sp. NBC_01455]|nr:hypothetical protein [Streptomyces sp. NBC_01455]
MDDVFDGPFRVVERCRNFRGIEPGRKLSEYCDFPNRKAGGCDVSGGFLVPPPLIPDLFEQTAHQGLRHRSSTSGYHVEHVVDVRKPDLSPRYEGGKAEFHGSGELTRSEIVCDEYHSGRMTNGFPSAARQLGEDFVCDLRGDGEQDIWMFHRIWCKHVHARMSCQMGSDRFLGQ